MLFFKKKPKPEAEEADGEAKAAPDGKDSKDSAEEGEDAAEGEGAPKKSKLKLIIVAAAAGVLVLGGGGTGAFFLLMPKAGAAKSHLPKKKKEGEGSKKDDKNAPQIRDGPDGVTFYTLPDLVVNIQSPDGKPTFVKLKLTFEMRDAETADMLDADAPRLQDMFTSFLRELRPEDLAGSEGSFQLKMEIMRRVNLILAPKKIDQVLIEEMLIQ